MQSISNGRNCEEDNAHLLVDVLDNAMAARTARKAIEVAEYATNKFLCETVSEDEDEVIFEIDEQYLPAKSEEEVIDLLGGSVVSRLP